MRFHVKRFGSLATLISLVSMMLPIACSQNRDVSLPADKGDASAPFFEIRATSVEVDFPNQITFKLSAVAKETIAKVEFVLTDPNRKCGTPYLYTTPPRFKPGTAISAIYKHRIIQSEPLVPGSRLEYSWTLITNNGAVHRTAPASLPISDSRHAWNEIAEGNVLLHWYEGESDFAHTLLNAAVKSIAQIGEVFGVSPGQRVNLFVYSSLEDLHSAMFQPKEWTGGVALADYGTILLVVPPGETAYGKRVIAHEVTHLIVRQASFSCTGWLPGFPNEGLAMLSEGSLTPEAEQLLVLSVRNGVYYSAGGLDFGFDKDPAAVRLAYVQAYSMTKYLLERYGIDKIRNLFEVFKETGAVTVAFEHVYGIDLQEFWAEWLLGMQGQSPR
ncbi:MAG: hypothetical protein HY686_00645 [Chloroflexi bacterium]|nr:hypothetical protein [Chloroflexota bacterium]